MTKSDSENGLLETLRALAPVVTPGEWVGYSEPDVGLPYSLFVRDERGLLSELQYSLSGRDIDAIVTLRNALPELIAALEVVALVREVPQILPAAKLDEVAASAVDWDGSDIPENEPAKWETEAGVIRDMVAEIRAYRAIIVALPKEEV